MSGAVYRDAFELFADAAAIIKAECEALAALGCTYIQIDSPDIGTIVDPENRELRENLGRLTNFEVFLLEYYDERSGSFEPLAKAPDDKQIILGLVSSKTTILESVSDVTARIHEAAKYTGLERLGVSTQCGFSSTLPGANLTTEDMQQQKLELVAEVASTVW